MKSEKLYNHKLILLALFLSPWTGLLALDVNLKGTVKDPTGKPIQGARVVLSENNVSIKTGADGSFEFQHLTQGSYSVTAIAPYYQPNTVRVDVGGTDQTIEFTLKPTFLESQAINVTTRSIASDFLSTPQPTTVVEGRQLQRLRGQNVMSTLDNTPGVANLSTGAGAAKPVIRGLTGQRVLVMTDGVRQEEQQFGDDHTVEVDSFGIDRLEVVRGPASVLYGSDALGGVVNIIRSKAPTAKDNAPVLAGNISSNSFTNNRQDAGSISLYGYNKNLNVGYRVHTDERKASGIRTPNGKLPNTGINEKNISASIGTDGSWGNAYIDSFQRTQEQDLYDNPVDNPQGKGLQKLSHQKTHIHSFFILPLVNIELDAGYQRNNRREIPDKNRYAPIYGDLTGSSLTQFQKAYEIYQVNANNFKQGLNLFLDTTTFDAKVHHKEWKGLKGTLGFQGMNQKNVTIGTNPLVPGDQLYNVGFFFLEQWRVGDFTFSVGGRHDKRSISVSTNPALNVVQQTRNFDANTGTLGALWRFAKDFSLALNAGRGFRAPTEFELFANGVHEGTGKFELGKNTLRPETSLNYDTTLRYATDRLQLELSAFQNNINNYIYSVSTGAFDPISGFGIYNYRQDRAQLTGGEFSFQYQTTSWLVLSGGIDLLQGNVTKKVDPSVLLNLGSIDFRSILFDLENKNLPNMTPNRARFGTKFTTNKLFGLENPYFSVNGNFVQPQYRVGVLQTPSHGYNLYDLGFGAAIPGLSNGTDSATFDVGVQNLFNTKYVNPLSRYATYALNPGINITFKVDIPFTLISDSK
ncbi:TonB-dependent receptor [Leptospira inadai serovar Lyme str. 10]|uniref:TonB-dependent receptor n=2 Tax=Leptospira inadai serovar Lyme TaxID=293084 RepID=V6HN35_9LEPT|nr:TonB-dependent receptor [Leptospira inadai]EQA38305.1 TonB-dependent receptor [Leptospira inadai serovar Lyme str. 10]PNV74452.1 TonB-dependent receptor [Leptospira inadai serovar Lyme]